MASEFVFPKPRDWNTFEDIVCDVYSRKFENQNFQRYGRSGQKQFGVDIVGVVNNSILGIQCKHHPLDGIFIKEIRADIKRAEQFAPMLSELVFVTSADRDAKITSSVLTISNERKEKRKFAVTIKFWDDIYSWLSEYPDVLYKYFTKYFHPSELEKLSGFGLERNKITIEWPAKEDVLQVSIRRSLKEIAKIDPYKIALGVSTFADAHFDGLVDLNISLANCLSGSSPDSGFVKAAKIFRDVKSLIKPPFYSKELFVHLQSRLPYALLFGWVFRKVTGYEFKIFSSNQIWATRDLPLVFTHLQDSPPEMLNMNSSDLVFVLSISRDIGGQVSEYVGKWKDKPKAIVSYRYLTSSSVSPALAMSMALEISQKIKSFKDNWALGKIHLFQALPAGLATLIGYNLNSICPISLYYMDNNDFEFHIGGTLTNEM